MTAIEPSSPAHSAAPVARRHRYASSALVSAAPEAVFARLDDQTRLAAHMQRSSAMMGGGRMAYAFDECRGQAVGSHIHMTGAVFGLRLEVDEVVTERTPPTRKVWRTTGAPRLLVISSYEMGFALSPEAQRTRLEVWIDYDISPRPLGCLLATWLSALYARWCIRRMVGDAVAAFQQP
jgi:hypothetical protein